MCLGELSLSVYLSAFECMCMCAYARVYLRMWMCLISFNLLLDASLATLSLLETFFYCVIFFECGHLVWLPSSASKIRGKLIRNIKQR